MASASATTAAVRHPLPNEKSFDGGCHCGAVRWRVRVNLHEQTVVMCNCSICAKKGFLHLMVPPDQFELLPPTGVNATAAAVTAAALANPQTPPPAVATYTFNTGVAKHLFCNFCGVHSYYRPRSHPTEFDVNVRCIDGYDYGRDSDGAPDALTTDSKAVVTSGTVVPVNERRLFGMRMVGFDGRNWEKNIAGIQSDASVLAAAAAHLHGTGTTSASASDAKASSTSSVASAAATATASSTAAAITAPLSVPAMDLQAAAAQWAAAAVAGVAAKRLPWPTTKLLANITRLQEHKSPRTTYVVLVSTGALCPVHRMHVQQFHEAKAHIERHYPDRAVVAGYLSPTHDAYVQSKLANSGWSSIAGADRLAMAELATQHTDWLSAGAYELAASGFIDFPAVTEHAMTTVHKAVGDSGLVPAAELKSRVLVTYVCGTDHALKCRLYGGGGGSGHASVVAALAAAGLSWANGGVVAIGRPASDGATTDSARLAKLLPATGGYTTLVPSAAGAVDMSSSQLRELMVSGNTAAWQALVFPAVAAYMELRKLKFKKMAVKHF